MKKLSLLPVILLLSVAAMSQEKYVEVIVTDTMLVEPQEWIVHLNIEKKYDYSTVMDSVVIADTVGAYTPPPVMSRPTELEGTSIQQLAAMVKKFGGKVIFDTMAVTYNLTPMNSRSDDDRNFLNASFSSRKSLERFLNEAANLGDVRSQITATSNPKIQDLQLALEKKLMTAAKAKAARLAELGGGKLGGVLLISESTGSDENWFKTFIETMMKFEFDRKTWSLYMSPDKIKLEKSLKVRFAIL